MVAATAAVEALFSCPCHRGHRTEAGDRDAARCDLCYRLVRIGLVDYDFSPAVAAHAALAAEALAMESGYLDLRIPCF